MGCNAPSLRIVLTTRNREVGCQPATPLLCLTFARKENELGRGAKYTPGQIYRRLRKSCRVTKHTTYNSCNRARIGSLLGWLCFTSPLAILEIFPDVADAFACASHSL